MKLFLHASLVLTFVLSLSGCASLIHDSEQSLSITTYDESGSKIKGASCKLSNDFRSNTFDNQELVKVHRSYRDLQIECKKNGYTDATARVISSVNAGIYGNVVTAGIGAIFDHALGSAYTYPQQLDLVFGKELTLNKHSESARLASENASTVSLPLKPKPVAAVPTPALAVAPPANPVIASIPLANRAAGNSLSNPASSTSSKPELVAAPAAELPASRTAALYALSKWRSAWISRDPATYFGMYAKNYTSSSEWTAARQARLASAEKITLELSNIEVKLQDAKHLTISFHQDYRSPSYQDGSEKILYWEKIDGNWLIVNETLVSAPTVKLNVKHSAPSFRQQNAKL
ncbi:L,D-transpeptidase Cds6 family protein [Undibacterium parvum]|uniref:Cds6 C-terminal domain-containing protein n=1 Tax=Undibacterium parvum TaxID=401471 RepID=A0A3Q9BQU5_9BURK|nr:hypothetical protein [Undibacterium parvum]AZP11613.1 hypothetical protein EJN92_06125 [Undibacterium parvum]